MTTDQLDPEPAVPSQPPPKKRRKRRPPGEFNTAELARMVVLEDEHRPRFDSLVRSLVAELVPKTSVEHALVARIAVAQWRTLRVWAWEKATLTDNHFDSGVVSDAPTRDAKIAVHKAEACALLRAHEASYDRQFARSLDRLFKFRIARYALKKLLTAPKEDL